MIIGRGLLGKTLAKIDSAQYYFYVNGISNSVLNDIPRNNFEINEIEEIANANEKRIFVYFSSCQVNSKINHNRAYVKHKLKIEKLITERFSHYLIVRTSNLVGNNPWNTHTLFNYLFNALALKERITVDTNLIRNFLDVDHFVKLLHLYLVDYKTNKSIEIVNPISYTMGEIVRSFEQYYSMKFNLNQVNGVYDFALFKLHPQLTFELINKCDLIFNEYIHNLLKVLSTVATS